MLVRDCARARRQSIYPQCGKVLEGFEIAVKDVSVPGSHVEEDGPRGRIAWTTVAARKMSGNGTKGRVDVVRTAIRSCYTGRHLRNGLDPV